MKQKSYYLATDTLLSQTPREPHTRFFQILSFTHALSNGVLLWTQAKRKAIIYKSVFVLFSLFFAALTLLIIHSKLYLTFSLFILSSFVMKTIFGSISGSLSLWALTLAVKLNPFNEQVISMEKRTKERLLKCWRSLEGTSLKHPLKNLHRLYYHEAEENIEKALSTAYREQQRLRGLPLMRRQRFYETANLLEILENQLEKTLELFKEKLTVTFVPSTQHIELS